MAFKFKAKILFELLYKNKRCEGLENVFFFKAKVLFEVLDKNTR